MVDRMREHAEEVVVWVRVPKGVPLGKLRDIGLEAGVCHGGDTCICAPAFTKGAGIVAQGPPGIDPRELFKRAGLKTIPRCFGGDTCIV